MLIILWYAVRITKNVLQIKYIQQATGDYFIITSCPATNLLYKVAVVYESLPDSYIIILDNVTNHKVGNMQNRADTRN